MRRSNLRITGIQEREDFQLKEPVNIFNKIIEENIPNLRKVVCINIQEAYRTQNRLDQKRNYSHHITVKKMLIHKFKQGTLSLYGDFSFPMSYICFN